MILIKMNVIIPYFNYTKCPNRLASAQRVLDELSKNRFLNLIVIELALEGDTFQLNSQLQLRTKDPLFLKENLINIAIKSLLPQGWHYVCWLDSDVLTEGFNVDQTFLSGVQWKKLEELLNTKEPTVVQPYSQVFEIPSVNFRKFSRAISEDSKNGEPGFIWAINKAAFEKLDGLFEYAIVGGSDSIMSHALLQLAWDPVVCKFSKSMQSKIGNYYEKAQGISVKNLEGYIYHINPGNPDHRQYLTRWKLVENIDLDTDVEKNEQGLLILTANSKLNKDQIQKYFKLRDS
jgi:hypothetical protein